MSLRNRFAGNSYGVFENMDINNTLNVDGQIIYQGQTLNPNGGGTNSITIDNTDDTLNIAENNGNYTINSNNCVAPGQNFNMRNGNLNNVNSVNVGIGNFTIASGTIGTITNSSNGIGQIYDSTFNFPYLSTILAKSNDALGSSINNLNSVSCQSLNVNGTVNAQGYQINGVPISNGSAQNINQVLTTGSDAGTNSITNLNMISVNNKINMGAGNHFVFQADSSGNLNINNSVNRQLQLKANGDVVASATGNLYVTNNVTTGQVYDSVFNPPPSGSSVKVLAYLNDIINTQSVTQSNLAVEWQLLDTTQQMGTADVVVSGNGNTSFQNSGSVAHLYNVSGYVTFSNTGTPGSSIAIFAVLNNGSGQTIQSRIWYDNTTIDNDYPSIPFSFNVVLQPLDFFTLYAWTNSAQQVMINGQQSPFTSRIITAEH
jgi:hypothetical protein